MRRLVIGSILVYLLKEGQGKGQQRPLIVTKVNKNGSPNGKVLLDGANDLGNEFNTNLEGHAFTVPEDQDGKIPGSWAWPQSEEVEEVEEEAPPA